jgi:hypothetical protein
MDYLRCFRNFFITEQDDYKQKKYLKKNKFDEFDEKIIDSINKEIFYSNYITDNTKKNRNLSMSKNTVKPKNNIIIIRKNSSIE